MVLQVELIRLRIFFNFITILEGNNCPIVGLLCVGELVGGHLHVVVMVDGRAGHSLQGDPHFDLLFRACLGVRFLDHGG